MEWFRIDIFDGVVTAAATAVIAIFTIVLVRVTTRQVGLTKDALTTTERAFVFLENFNPDIKVRNEQVFEKFIVKLSKNAGTTPTRNMMIQANWTEIGFVLPPAGAEDTYDDKLRLNMFLGPQATEWSTPIVIPPEVATRALKGDTTIFIWGRVDYHDIFDGTKPHFTRWCYRIHFGQGPMQPQFIAVGNNNGTDEDSRTI